MEEERNNLILDKDPDIIQLLEEEKKFVKLYNSLKDKKILKLEEFKKYNLNDFNRINKEIIEESKELPSLRSCLSNIRLIISLEGSIIKKINLALRDKEVEDKFVKLMNIQLGGLTDEEIKKENAKNKHSQEHAEKCMRDYNKEIELEIKSIVSKSKGGYKSNYDEFF